MRRSTQGGTAVLEKKTQPIAVTTPVFLQLSRNDRIESVAAVFDKRPNHLFGTVKNIEHTAPDVLREMSVAGSAFEPMADHLTSQGVPVKTIGGVMQALELTQVDAHYIACFCHERSPTITGESVALNLRSRWD
jgi:hypothetical protein